MKEQKEIGAKISVVSNQQMNRVREQTTSLKHLLSTVAVGLHRNVVALDKLKKQTSQVKYFSTLESPMGKLTLVVTDHLYVYIEQFILGSPFILVMFYR